MRNYNKDLHVATLSLIREQLNAWCIQFATSTKVTGAAYCLKRGFFVFCLEPVHDLA